VYLDNPTSLALKLYPFVTLTDSKPDLLIPGLKVNRKKNVDGQGQVKLTQEKPNIDSAFCSFVAMSQNCVPFLFTSK
jgi:hypothetical protein